MTPALWITVVMPWPFSFCATRSVARALVRSISMCSSFGCFMPGGWTSSDTTS